MKRISDIQQILFSRGQETQYSTDDLYALFDSSSPLAVRRARAKLTEMKWHLIPKEDREAALYDLNIQSLMHYRDLFCDFSCGGYRLLGDLICDADDMNRRRDITKRIRRKNDSADTKWLLTGVSLNNNYEERITENCVSLISPFVAGMEKLNENEVLKCAEALGERDFALKVLPLAVLSNLIDPNAEKRGRKRR